MGSTQVAKHGAAPARLGQRCNGEGRRTNSLGPELQGRVGRLPSHQRHAFLHLMQPRFGPNTRRGPMIRTHALVLADILRPTGRSDCSTLYVPPLVPGMTSSTFPPTTLSPSSFLASSRRAE